MGIFHDKVQELAGEIGTGIILGILGYKLAPFTIHSVQGPDQVAQHEAAKTWGIFEAKGGHAKLGTGIGGQMGKQWISTWLQRIIDRNATTEYRASLSDAFENERVMLAAVVNLNMHNKDGEFRMAFQKYKPKTGAYMKPWGPEWQYYESIF